MELVEKKYRDTPENSKKYIKRLTEYINFLLSGGRIIEAKYFFDKLSSIKPEHQKTIRLGYTLSIYLFDKKGVVKYDSLLYKIRKSDSEINFYRLKYYYSMNDIQNSEECCVHLLSQNLKQDQLNIIFQACINQNSYRIAVALIEYLNKNKLRLNNKTNSQVKKVLFKKFVDIMALHAENQNA